jgi:hypothetical protein
VIVSKTVSIPRNVIEDSVRETHKKDHGAPAGLTATTNLNASLGCNFI